MEGNEKLKKNEREKKKQEEIMSSNRKGLARYQREIILIKENNPNQNSRDSLISTAYG